MKPILEVQHVSKKYKLSHKVGGYLSLRERIQNALKFQRSTTEDFFALSDVSFEVQPGDSIGIIGRNGAGKSTLLKILSKITPPSKGKIITRGRIASLLEVGTGFHPELTGRENIYFNGSLLGMKRKEIENTFDEIVNFSGVEKFLDTPLKHFSSGMQLRLAFSVAAFLEPEILVIDEVLAVGDAEFQKKCLGKMEDVSKSGRTILFVSHNIGAVAQLCKKSILLKQGCLTNVGNSSEIIRLYLADSLSKEQIFSRETSPNEVYFSYSSAINVDGEPTTSFIENEEISLRFKIKINKPVKDVVLAVALLDKHKKRVFTIQKLLSDYTASGKDEVTLSVCIPSTFLLPGNYSWYLAMHIPFVRFVDLVDDVNSFEVIDSGGEFTKYGNFDFGIVHAPASIVKIG